MDSVSGVGWDRLPRRPWRLKWRHAGPSGAHRPRPVDPAAGVGSAVSVGSRRADAESAGAARRELEEAAAVRARRARPHRRSWTVRHARLGRTPRVPLVPARGVLHPQSARGEWRHRFRGRSAEGGGSLLSVGPGARPADRQRARAPQFRASRLVPTASALLRASPAALPTARRQA